MKKIKYFTIITALLISTAACNELLDQMPNNSISGTSMWTTETQADMGVIGVYDALQRPVQGGQLVGEGVNLGHYAFDVFGMTGQSRLAMDNIFTSGVNPGNTRFLFTWRWCYTGVNRANNAIAYIPDIPMNDKKKARLIAECKALRAFFYMRLNELYGNNGIGVPLYLEPVSPSDYDRGQSSEAEVWAQVIADLTDAINEPELSNHQIMGEGRISKGAAYAFRGRAYLLSKEYDKAIADFAKVGEFGYKLYPDYKKLFKVEQERCEEMIFSVQYIEEPAGYGNRVQKYCAAFTQGARDGRGCWTDIRVTAGIAELYEVVVDGNTVKPFKWSDFIPEWESVSMVEHKKVFFIRDEKVNGEAIHPTITTAINAQLNLPDNIKSMYMPEGNEARILAAFAKRDPRLACNIVTPYSNYLGVTNTSSEAVWYTFRFPVPSKVYGNEPGAEPNLNPNLPRTYYASGYANENRDFVYLLRKFVGEGLEYARREHNPIDEPIIRYADVLLMWAEALVEKNDLNGAMAIVKQVRDRAGVPTMVSSFANQTTARNYVRDERRRELMGEGVNFFDEMRWRTLRETKFSKGHTHTIWGGTTVNNQVYQWAGDQWYTWPVPRAEIEMNPNLKLTPNWVY